jgi:hypothetical protein
MLVTSNTNPIAIVLNLLELIQDEIIARKGLEHCGQPINLDATLMTSEAAALRRSALRAIRLPRLA